MVPICCSFHSIHSFFPENSWYKFGNFSNSEEELNISRYDNNYITNAWIPGLFEAWPWDSRWYLMSGSFLGIFEQKWPLCSQLYIIQMWNSGTNVAIFFWVNKANIQRKPEFRKIIAEKYSQSLTLSFDFFCKANCIHYVLLNNKSF